MAIVQETGAASKPLLKTNMGVGQYILPGSKPRIPRVVSKSDSNHWRGYYAHRTLGLTPAGTMCHSNLSLGYYPIHTRCPILTTGRVLQHTEPLG